MFPPAALCALGQPGPGSISCRGARFELKCGMPAKKATSKPRKGTHSSSFGAAGRVNHDASAFYKSALYAEQPVERAATEVENPFPKSARNRIFAHSSQDMQELPEGCVHLMVTSPPYNAGKEYDQDLNLDDYLAMLHQVW